MVSVVRRVIRFSGLMLLGAIIIAWTLQPAMACSLKVGWEDYPPFQVRDGHDATGLDLQLFRNAAALAGCQVTTREIPWRRLLNMIEAGRMDAAMGASITPEREAFAFFSDSYRNDEFVLFVRNGDLDQVGPGGLSDLVGKRFRLGTVGGYSYGAVFDTLMRDPRFVRQVQSAPSTVLNLRKLVAGRIDGFIGGRPVGIDIAKKEGVLAEIAVHPVPVSSDPVHFMFSKQSVTPDVVTAFNRALAEMKANGRSEAIMDAYLH